MCLDHLIDDEGDSAHNIQFKPSLRAFALHSSDVPTQVSFANSFAIIMQTKLPQSRRLTGCYVLQGV
jgi:hypothetical protein